MYPNDQSISSYSSNPSTPVNSPPPLTSQTPGTSLSIHNSTPSTSWQQLTPANVVLNNPSTPVLNGIQNGQYAPELVHRGLHMVIIYHLWFTLLLLISITHRLIIILFMWICHIFVKMTFINVAHNFFANPLHIHHENLILILLCVFCNLLMLIKLLREHDGNINVKYSFFMTNKINSHIYIYF